MKRVTLALIACLSLAFTAYALATEPCVGVWQLDHQELDGQKRETEPLTLRITPDGNKLLFAFSVLVNNIDFVSMTYDAALDGTEADVKNVRGTKIGTVQLTSISKSHYKLVLKGDKRPDTVVNLTVSSDGKTLTSDSLTKQADHSAHLVQTFLRH